MEYANSTLQIGTPRLAESADTAALAQLLRSAAHTHTHADWRAPGEWVGDPGFYVLTRSSGTLTACMAAAPDPPPAAWVRLASFRYRADIAAALPALLDAVIPALQAQGVNEVAWLLAGSMLERHLQAAAFAEINAIETYVKEDAIIPPGPPSQCTIRGVESADLPQLVAIEARAFGPLWRHSQAALRGGRRYAFSFDVAEIDGQVVGFQYSTKTENNGVHLVRITVDPRWQGRGIGHTLMAHALTTYRAHGLRTVTLNTQSDNVASRRLYTRFGFRPTGDRYPVWSLSIDSAAATGAQAQLPYQGNGHQ
jgi:ribosomal protein S18 acetylase RimI-like enzyme